MTESRESIMAKNMFRPTLTMTHIGHVSQRGHHYYLYQFDGMKPIVTVMLTNTHPFFQAFESIEDFVGCMSINEPDERKPVIHLFDDENRPISDKKEGEPHARHVD